MTCTIDGARDTALLWGLARKTGTRLVPGHRRRAPRRPVTGIERFCSPTIELHLVEPPRRETESPGELAQSLAAASSSGDQSPTSTCPERLSLRAGCAAGLTSRSNADLIVRAGQTFDDPARESGAGPQPGPGSYRDSAALRRTLECETPRRCDRSAGTEIPGESRPLAELRGTVHTRHGDSRSQCASLAAMRESYPAGGRPLGRESSQSGAPCLPTGPRRSRPRCAFPPVSTARSAARRIACRLKPAFQAVGAAQG